MKARISLEQAIKLAKLATWGNTNPKFRPSVYETIEALKACGFNKQAAELYSQAHAWHERNN